MIHAELQRRPSSCHLRHRIEFADIDFANAGEIVIADKNRVGEEIHHFVEHSRGLGP